MRTLRATIEAQTAAADPAVSAFVAANAGSGKTRVLTSRVARLLLSGAPPGKILCITFTKAAAAEMAGRLFAMLGEWSLAEDDVLLEKLNELEGGASKRSPPDLAMARRLFARALETPGGLKIQTIHAFCESILKRFPLEAGVAPGFSVIDESESAGLAQSALERTVMLPDDETATALYRLAGRYNPIALKKLLLASLTSRQALDKALASIGGWDEILREIAAFLSVEADKDEVAALMRAISVCNETFLVEIRNALLDGKMQAKALANDVLDPLITEKDAQARLTLLQRLFLKSDGEPREKFGDTEVSKAHPTLQPKLIAMRDNFLAALESYRSAAIFADTRAFLSILRKALATFEEEKAARASLDYDDLIRSANRLFSGKEGAAWALYKLDQGLDHILLDEAQDTSPAQWRVIEGPLQEFFAGDGAREAERTFFAVGDQKQSIYSFQGADAGLFREKRADLGKRIAAASRFVDKPLTLSFRSTATILTFVDALFAEPEARNGLGEDGPLRHGVRREGAAGRVEVWPLVPSADKAESPQWEAPVDAEIETSPRRILAESIARTVKEWLEKGERLESQNRPVEPGDLLFLVQSRSAIFHETIGALARAGVPIAGADRLKLLEDPAIEDLLSFARAALLSFDDLSLAETLKSPFFDLNDDDLFALTRGPESRLWLNLFNRRAEISSWKRAAEEIAVARIIALRGGAYAFFSHVLETGAPSGRRRLYQRLGEASREPVDELLRLSLDYETSHPRSLQNFLAWIEGAASDIKRETGERASVARVMTVHGAKGLEAPVVFLLDAQRAPKTDAGPRLPLRQEVRTKRHEDGLFAIVRSKEADCMATGRARHIEKELRYEEHRRLLYVAATRACDRLYVCGVTDSRVKNPGAKPVREKTWHALAIDAMERLDTAVKRVPHPEGWGDILRLEAAQTTPAETQPAQARALTAAIPVWLDAPAPTERRITRLAPSRLSNYADSPEETAAYSPSGPRHRHQRGIVLHRMLELLPDIAPVARDAAARRLLSRLAPALSAEERDAWRNEVFSVLDHPEFAPVFASSSRAEVPIAGRPKGARDDVFVTGTIDRLAVETNKILVVDYKTNRPPPACIEDASPVYIAQLAAYRALLQEIFPGRTVVCGLLWTFEARLVLAPSFLLDHAFRKHFA